MPNEVIMCFAIFALMVADIVTGIAAAAMKGNVSSSVMREGLFHKFGSIVIVMLGLGIQYAGSYVGIDSAITTTAATGICGMVAVMELTSVVENACKLNPELPVAKIFALVGLEKDGE